MSISRWQYESLQFTAVGRVAGHIAVQWDGGTYRTRDTAYGRTLHAATMTHGSRTVAASGRGGGAVDSRAEASTMLWGLRVLLIDDCPLRLGSRVASLLGLCQWV